MDVVCVGILVADVVANPIDAVPAAGQLKLAERYLLAIGGCAANTAVALRKFQRSVRVVGKLGADLFGDFVLSELTREGIDASGIARSSARQTSATLIVNVRGEDRRFVHCMGANADFSLADVDLSALDKARALYVGGYMAMPAFGPDQLARLMSEAKRRGLLTALDVVIASGSSFTLDDVREALPFTDLFLPNDDEARALTGRSDPASQAAALAALNPDCTVVITQGSNGCLAQQRGRRLFAPPYRVEAIDQTGAGDAFAAGFITGMLEGWPLEKTIRFASAAGASCTQALGTTAGVFSLQEALDYVERHPLEVRGSPADPGNGAAATL